MSDMRDILKLSGIKLTESTGDMFAGALARSAEEDRDVDFGDLMALKDLVTSGVNVNTLRNFIDGLHPTTRDKATEILSQSDSDLADRLGYGAELLAPAMGDMGMDDTGMEVPMDDMGMDDMGMEVPMDDMGMDDMGMEVPMDDMGMDDMGMDDTGMDDMGMEVPMDDMGMEVPMDDMGMDDTGMEVPMDDMGMDDTGMEVPMDDTGMEAGLEDEIMDEEVDDLDMWLDDNQDEFTLLGDDDLGFGEYYDNLGIDDEMVETTQVYDTEDFAPAVTQTKTPAKDADAYYQSLLLKYQNFEK